MSAIISDNHRVIRAVAIGVLTALLMSLLLTCLFGLIIQFMPGVPYGIIDYVMIAIEGLSVLLGAYIASMIIKNKGMIIGLVSAVISLLILIAVGMSTASNDISLLTVIRAAVMLICGVAGGIMGVNRKEKIRIK